MNATQIHQQATCLDVCDADLSGLAISDARLDGMTIEGIAVPEMIALWQANRKGAGNAQA